MAATFRERQIKVWWHFLSQCWSDSFVANTVERHQDIVIEEDAVVWVNIIMILHLQNIECVMMTINGFSPVSATERGIERWG